jgi:riboflavin transporter FmnP
MERLLISMNTKALAITIVFAALTVALNPAISGIGVPAPYAPFLIYNLWEIPIVAAFILISPFSAISITLLNAVVLFGFFQGPLPTGPLYNLIAIMSTLTGIYIARKFIKGKVNEGKIEFKIATAATMLGVIFRVVVMTLVNYVTLRYPYPIGFGMSEIEIIGFLPLGALFNGTLALYTIPTGEFIAKIVKSRLKLSNIT